MTYISTRKDRCWNSFIPVLMQNFVRWFLLRLKMPCNSEPRYSALQDFLSRSISQWVGGFQWSSFLLKYYKPYCISSFASHLSISYFLNQKPQKHEDFLLNFLASSSPFEDLSNWRSVYKSESTILGSNIMLPSFGPLTNNFKTSASKQGIPNISSIQRCVLTGLNPMKAVFSCLVILIKWYRADIFIFHIFVVKIVFFLAAWNLHCSLKKSVSTALWIIFSGRTGYNSSIL